MLSLFDTIPATYVRPSGAYVAHRWVATAELPAPIRVIFPQRVDGATLQMLPEGDRQYTHLVTWTKTELWPNDLLEIRGVQYRVVKQEDWSADGNFHEVIIRKVQVRE